MVFLLTTKCSSNLVLTVWYTSLSSSVRPNPAIMSSASSPIAYTSAFTCIASCLPPKLDASRYRSKGRIHFAHSFEVHCPRSPVGAQLLANCLHDASRWLVIAKAITQQGWRRRGFEPGEFYIARLSRGAVYNSNTTCRRYPFWSYPAG